MRSRYPDRGGRINEGPGKFLEEPRAFYMLARIKARSPCLYASDARLCPVARRAGSMGAREKTYRLYSCGRCAEQVRICCECDRGNLYCAGECALIRRRESLRRAGERYQLSYRGACLHAARQSAWRSRRAQKVTHQGSPEAVLVVIVAASSIATPGNHAERAPVTPPLLDNAAWALARRVRGRARCCFCGRALPRFARWGFLRSGP